MKKSRELIQLLQPCWKGAHLEASASCRRGPPFSKAPVISWTILQQWNEAHASMAVMGLIVMRSDNLGTKLSLML